MICIVTHRNIETATVWSFSGRYILSLSLRTLSLNEMSASEQISKNHFLVIPFPTHISNPIHRYVQFDKYMHKSSDFTGIHDRMTRTSKWSDIQPIDTRPLIPMSISTLTEITLLSFPWTHNHNFFTYRIHTVLLPTSFASAWPTRILKVVERWP